MGRPKGVIMRSVTALQSVQVQKKNGYQATQTQHIFQQVMLSVKT